MNKILILSFFVTFGLFQLGWSQKTEPSETASIASPKSGDLMLGLIVGSPTGVSGKYWTSKRGAVDAALGFPFDSDVRFNFHTDYLYHFPISANVPGTLPFYVGAGARLRALDKENSNDNADFGIRVPLGLEFIPSSVPLEFFAEIAPVIVIAPRGDVNLDGGAGIRYKFSTGSVK